MFLSAINNNKKKQIEEYVFILSLIPLLEIIISRPILAVYCMQWSHTITCPFSK